MRVKMMRTYDKVNFDMVTDFVGELPKFCSHCGASCWQTDDYPYACRCPECSAYFHRVVSLCSDLSDRSDDTSYLCTRNVLRVFELNDGRLVEVCQACANRLYEEGFINNLPDFEDGIY